VSSLLVLEVEPGAAAGDGEAEVRALDWPAVGLLVALRLDELSFEGGTG
jgi:hypothetical protein